ncbi:MAG: hypothetical protein OEY01_11480 [Desulfobulbaceae bacterium]|nr:hypothetical protein [Desulfobulbaceae bacterium]HIJ79473.1 hypothetical protein [Deltaproteobacteria bacterium]
MEDINFDQNHFIWRLNFRFDFWNEEDINRIIRKILLVTKEFDINYIEQQKDEKEVGNVVFISNKKEARDDNTKSIRLFSQGFVCAVGPAVSYEEWKKIRSAICLAVLEHGNVDEASLVRAIDAQLIINIPNDKIEGNIFTNIFKNTSTIANSCPFENPTLLDFHVMLKDGLYKSYIGLDSEFEINDNPYHKFLIAFPIQDFPVDVNLKDSILEHFAKVDEWGKNIAKSIILPILS